MLVNVQPRHRPAEIKHQSLTTRLVVQQNNLVPLLIWTLAAVSPIDPEGLFHRVSHQTCEHQMGYSTFVLHCWCSARINKPLSQFARTLAAGLYHDKTWCQTWNATVHELPSTCVLVSLDILQISPNLIQVWSWWIITQSWTKNSVFHLFLSVNYCCILYL